MKRYFSPLASPHFILCLCVTLYKVCISSSSKYKQKIYWSRWLLNYTANAPPDWLFANPDWIIFLNNGKGVLSFGRAANNIACSATPRQLVTSFRKALRQQPWNPPFLWSLLPCALATSSHRVSGWWKTRKITLSHTKLQTECLSEHGFLISDSAGKNLLS